MCAILRPETGPIVRIAPNEYSIDDPQSAKIIYRSANQLMKVIESASNQFT